MGKCKLNTNIGGGALAVQVNPNLMKKMIDTLGVLRKFKQIKSIAICYCREIVETGQDMED